MEKRNMCMALVEKPEGRKQLERHRNWWKDIIKVDLKEVA
jgi:hypothetical protein